MARIINNYFSAYPLPRYRHDFSASFHGYLTYLT